MEEVKSIKALLDAAKPFMEALPKDSAMAKIVAAYVDAERVASGNLSQSDADYFGDAASVIYAASDDLAGRYVGLIGNCRSLPSVKVDSWDGCEYAD